MRLIEANEKVDIVIVTIKRFTNTVHPGIEYLVGNLQYLQLQATVVNHCSTCSSCAACERYFHWCVCHHGRCWSVLLPAASTNAAGREIETQCFNIGFRFTFVSALATVNSARCTWDHAGSWRSAQVFCFIIHMRNEQHLRNEHYIVVIWWGMSSHTSQGRSLQTM